MRLISEKGEIALPDNFSFTIEKESPFFGDSGTSSIPVTLPGAQDTFNKLERPERIARSTAFMRKVKAKIEAGIIHKDGFLVVDTVKSRGGITASLALDESDLYVAYKDKTLPEIFDGVVRKDYSSVDGWVEHLLKCASGEADDWFTIATVAVNKDEADDIISYQFLNDVDVASNNPIWPLIYRTRTISENDTDIIVPGGYGVAPFFYLGKFLDVLMEQMGYTLRNNKFRTDAVLKKIIMLHNVADAICPGTLTVSDIVPTCTLSDFIEFLLNRFHAQIFVYPEAQVADVVFFEDILSAAPDLDISGLLDGECTVTYPSPKQVDLKSKTDLDDSEAAAATLNELVKTYPYMQSVSEDAYKHNFTGVCLRRALGRFYTGNYAQGKYTYKHLGTNNFDYCLSTLEAEEFSAVDASYGMISYIKDNSLPQRPIVAPYIGDKRHVTTSYLGENDSDSEQYIILAFAPSLAASGDGIKAGYYLATNQKYDNLGEEWNSWGLNFADMYTVFWEGYNNLLQNAAPVVSGKFDFTPEQLISLRLDKPKLYNGVPVVMNSISYDVGRVFSCKESKYTAIVQLSDPVKDEQPVIRAQQYRWQRETNIEDIKAKYPSPQYNIISIAYDQEQVDYSDSLPVPSQLGLVGYNSEEVVTVVVEKFTSVDVVRESHDEVLKIWYKSVPL